MISNLRFLFYLKSIKKEFCRGRCSYFSPEFLEKLKGIYFDGFPLYPMIAVLRFTNGKCYERAIGLSYIFTEGKIVTGNLTKYAKIKQTANFDHAWIEHENFVYDTTFGIKFQKKYYYKIMGAVAKESQNIADIKSESWYIERFSDNHVRNSFFSMGISTMLETLKIEIKIQQKNKNFYAIPIIEDSYNYCLSLLKEKE